MHPGMPAARDVLTELSGLVPRDFFTWGYGRERDDSGVSVVTMEERALEMLETDVQPVTVWEVPS